MENITYYGVGKVDAYASVSGIAAAVKVFYYKLPETTNVSSFYRASVNRSYTIPNLQPGQYIVYAFFIDQDNDGAVSSGDISGISPEITVSAGNVTTVNLSLETVTSTSTVTVKEYFQSLLSTKK